MSQTPTGAIEKLQRGREYSIELKVDDPDQRLSFRYRHLEASSYDDQEKVHTKEPTVHFYVDGVATAVVVSGVRFDLPLNVPRLFGDDESTAKPFRRRQRPLIVLRAKEYRWQYELVGELVWSQTDAPAIPTV